MIGPSRSAMLVAAARSLSGSPVDGDGLCDDPFAPLFADDEAFAAAREQPAFVRVIGLRTRYIDDAVHEQVRTVGATADRPVQVVLLGAGNDARAFRLAVPARWFEIDLPTTLTHKDAVLRARGIESDSRTSLAVDLVSHRFVEPLLHGGFDRGAPALVICEGVTNYLPEAAAADLLGQIAEVLSTGDRLVIDFVRRSSFDRGFDRENAAVGNQLAAWGETLAAGFADLPASLEQLDFSVIDEGAVENLLPRYGHPPVTERRFPSRILTAEKR